ncbi:hypothetical protein, partial [Pseudomonas mandelii]|uniref:hypothetical protein n=1 Tax=Pseudomonas mandelii TaxID=75612 RepID=UPI003C72953D
RHPHRLKVRYREQARSHSGASSLYWPPESKTPLPPEAEAAEARASVDQCMNRAIRMMIGMGTPRKNSSNERMVILLG